MKDIKQARGHGSRSGKDGSETTRHWILAIICAICGNWVRASEVTLDHIEPRTAENIYDTNNIQPAHGACNYRKGSRRWKPRVNRETYEFLNFLINM